ncbi:transcriptional regulator, MerR family [Thermocrinis albus DSM 14484]|uniref:Transcriptional regulator, MerR family n=1 Tax=Thermocrinis albus (strain DSM 14484 / JCM 11386 / HI 11/12) TaxID=638303 RepID=D3SNF8_THEAH|nr:helix-turn-helix transcriptional regulator [Thermocrinis albus]ADC88695.1 transcriptional regulator, MerR family [Thermocrinis albus DSM 14484]
MRQERKEKFTIGIVAEMYKIHPQTLRLYEKEGLLKPSRSKGRTRYYTREDLERLEFILFLSRELGVNLAGIDIILRMKDQIEELEKQLQKLVEFIQRELSEKYERNEEIKSIVLAQRRTVIKLEDILSRDEDKGD